MAVRGKRRRPDVAWFLFRCEEQLESLREQISSETWEPSKLALVTIRDPKPRLIARVPIQDRVVHRSLVELLQPVFLRGARTESFACRPGYGTHRARLRLLELMRRFRFAVHLDVRSYFPSIDRTTAMNLVAARVADPAFVRLVARALGAYPDLYLDPELRRRVRIDSDWPPPDRGIPIGSSLSQLIATHVYLGELDHVIKRSLKVPGYLRYVDDFFLFGQHRADLRSWRNEVGCWLERERGLRLKHPKARLLSCFGHLDALGFQITRSGLKPRRRAVRALERATTAWVTEEGAAGTQYLERMVASRVGLLMS